METIMVVLLVILTVALLIFRGDIWGNIKAWWKKQNDEYYNGRKPKTPKPDFPPPGQKPSKFYAGGILEYKPKPTKQEGDKL